MALKAITSSENEESLAFHRALGFTLTRVADYGGTGQPRVVMRKAIAAGAPPEAIAARGAPGAIAAEPPRPR